ncbi:hypothetical protein Pcinc_015899 [Petrolisthes cinctipes]|uniref:Uncharacterized protein n=1 Tax=Petrolisthes cinctipes TaxID=88211 RepID=A0AAE1FSD0_PETCI|nr:hypothetical protein Pcinc_015899 [Petrolisthes cinctipes]
MDGGRRGDWGRGNGRRRRGDWGRGNGRRRRGDWGRGNGRRRRGDWGRGNDRRRRRGDWGRGNDRRQTWRKVGGRRWDLREFILWVRYFRRGCGTRIGKGIGVWLRDFHRGCRRRRIDGSETRESVYGGFEARKEQDVDGRGFGGKGKYGKYRIQTNVEVHGWLDKHTYIFLFTRATRDTTGFTGQGKGG